MNKLQTTENTLKSKKVVIPALLHFGEPFCPKCVEKYLEELKRSNPTAYDRYFGNFDNG